jgi:hypothetical protein
MSQALRSVDCSAGVCLRIPSKNFKTTVCAHDNSENFFSSSDYQKKFTWEGKVQLPAGRCKCVRGISNSRDEASWTVDDGVFAGFGGDEEFVGDWFGVSGGGVGTFGRKDCTNDGKWGDDGDGRVG